MGTHVRNSKLRTAEVQTNPEIGCQGIVLVKKQQQPQFSPNRETACVITTCTI